MPGPSVLLPGADPLPRVLDWLRGHPQVTAALGGAGRVGLYNEPPYPRLRVTDPPGAAARPLRWLTATSLQLEAYGDLGGDPGKDALRACLWTALGALAELPDQPAGDGQPVITAVTLDGSGWVPEPTGQPRYLATVTVLTHPPVSP